MIRQSVMAVSLAAALAAGAWTAQAQDGKGANKRGGERHPVLQNSIHQLEGIKDRLQKAPTDFGGHRERAVDAIGHAIGELQQAIAFDKQ
jgi:ABC-type sugar transport system substrate-binding protein